MVFELTQGPKRRRGFPRDGEEDLPEHSRRAAGSKRGGVRSATQACVAGPPARRAARRARQLRLLTARRTDSGAARGHPRRRRSSDATHIIHNR